MSQGFTQTIRASEWWSFKLAAVLGTAYGTVAVLHGRMSDAWPYLAFTVLSLATGAAYVSVINNIFDRDEDAASGKPNSFIGRSRAYLGVVLGACLAAGVLMCFLLRGNPAALGLYVFNWLLFACYSVPPVRLKARGLLGVLAIGVGESLVPHWYAIVTVAHGVGGSSSPMPDFLIPLVSLWALALGLRAILWHQIGDWTHDRAAGVQTFAVRHSVRRLELLGRFVVFPVEVAAFAGILWICGAAAQGALLLLLVVYGLTEWGRHAFWNLDIVVVTPGGRGHRLLLFEYYDLFYPVGFLIGATLVEPAVGAMVLAVHLLLYYKRAWWWLRDVWALVRWEIPRWMLGSRRDLIAVGREPAE